MQNQISKSRPAIMFEQIEFGLHLICSWWLSCGAVGESDLLMQTQTHMLLFASLYEWKHANAVVELNLLSLQDVYPRLRLLVSNYYKMFRSVILNQWAQWWASEGHLVDTVIGYLYRIFFSFSNWWYVVMAYTWQYLQLSVSVSFSSFLHSVLIPACVWKGRP